MLQLGKLLHRELEHLAPSHKVCGKTSSRTHLPQLQILPSSILHCLLIALDRKQSSFCFQETEVTEQTQLCAFERCYCHSLPLFSTPLKLIADGSIVYQTFWDLSVYITVFYQGSKLDSNYQDHSFPFMRTGTKITLLQYLPNSLGL